MKKEERKWLQPAKPAKKNGLRKRSFALNAKPVRSTATKLPKREFDFRTKPDTEEILWRAAVRKAAKEDKRTARSAETVRELQKRTGKSKRTKPKAGRQRVPGRIPGQGRRGEWENPGGRMNRFLEAREASRFPEYLSKRKPLSGKRRQLLWLNPGDSSIEEALHGVRDGSELPAWAERIGRDQFSIKKGRLHMQGLPFAWRDEKRDAVKDLYFAPEEPSTIAPIADRLYGLFANISKKNVTAILRSLETYQLNFPRRLPPKIQNRTLYTKPGLVAVDNFFPSAKHGWIGKSQLPVLVCMDIWSRYVRAFALNRKSMANSSMAVRLFLMDLASRGHVPRRILADKGTDLPQRDMRTIMEVFRTPKDGDSPMVINSATGTPVLVVENMNAQIQRRLAVFRTAGLTDDPSTILGAITDQLNNQKRPRRGNLTPIQLLDLTAKERQVVNKAYAENFVVNSSEALGLKPIRVNDTVRVLLMTRKEQVTHGVKGFAPKWSTRVFTVLRRTGIRNMPGTFRYDVGLTITFYRHELLKIPKTVDRTVPTGTVNRRPRRIDEERATESATWLETSSGLAPAQ